MLPEQVDEMLKSYRECVGRCGHLKSEIDETEKLIAELSATALADASVRAQQYTGMPHGSGVSNPTEQVACMFADGYMPEEIKRLQKELADMKREFRERYPTVHFVEAWMQGLTEKERWIIEQQVIDGVTWRDIMTRCRLKFGIEYTKDGLKRIKARALEKIYKIAA